MKFMLSVWFMGEYESRRRIICILSKIWYVFDMGLAQNKVLARVVVDRKDYERFRKVAKMDSRSFSSWALVALKEKSIIDERRLIR